MPGGWQRALAPPGLYLSAGARLRTRSSALLLQLGPHYVRGFHVTLPVFSLNIPGNATSLAVNPTAETGSSFEGPSARPSY